VNQQAVLNGMARNAYGAPGQTLYGAPGYAPAGLTMTAADVRQAVKDELKANQTWFDEMPWYVRVPLAIGTLAILNDLGITLPGL
jgi:hypothetical protein